MEMIVEFKGKKSLADKEQFAISTIVFDSFEQKIIGVSAKIDRDQWINDLKEILTFNSGIYLQKDKEIVGVAILNAKNAATFISFSKIVKQVGLYRAILFYNIFIGSVKSVQEIKLELLAVRSETRGSGVGGKLLTFLIDFAKKQNYKTLSLDVVDTNPKAKRLYE